MPGTRTVPDGDSGPIRPVFVGGTGRSGTTVVGKLLHRHPDLTVTRPRELRFISSIGGVADAYWTALGRPASEQRPAITPEKVVEMLWLAWFERRKPSGFISGLTLAIKRDALEIAADRYLSDFPKDPFRASRAFVEEVVRYRPAMRQTQRWVDTTPANARVADRMLLLFPDAVVVHMMRDGRDVAASFAQKQFGPDDVMEGLEAWRTRMIEAHLAEQAVPEGSVLRIDLQELVVTGRHDALQRLMRGIGVRPDRSFRLWFDANVTAAASNLGRWRQDYSPEMCAVIDHRYSEILAEFDRTGVPYPAPGDAQAVAPRRGQRGPKFWEQQRAARAAREVAEESRPAADDGATPP